MFRASPSRAPDDLTSPLGADRPEPGPSRLARLPWGGMVTGLALALTVGVGGWLALVDDPFGGQPHVVAPIVDRAGPAPGAEPARRDGLALVAEMPAQGPRATAVEEFDARAGVSVVRGSGEGASSAVIIEVPEGAPRDRAIEDVAGGASLRSGGLAPAPDPRLVERGRFGPLPRVGEDGSTPLSVYARPAARDALAAPARVAILVTGLGIGQSATALAIERLPPEASLAFAPYGGGLEGHVEAARARGHEILLQIPMEPFDYPASDPGPHTLTTGAAPAENRDRLHWVMSRIVGYVGVVNFMGARLTAQDGALEPILAEIGGRGLGYVDDGTSSRSLAPRVAASLGMPTARADLTLDAVADPAAVDAALARLEALALERGFAMGVASALPMSVERIARWAEAAQARGVRLVPVSSALAPRAGG